MNTSLATVKNSSTFDFEANSVEEMDITTLKRTHKEHDV